MKTTKQFIFFLIVIILSISIYSKNSHNKIESKKLKYLFFFIGDGMGLAQTNLTEFYLSSLRGKIGLEKLNMSRLTNLALISTFAENRLITDSAAAGTSLSSGNKTGINIIGLDITKKKKFTSVTELAKREGYKIGIISSVSIDHATPASFYAHKTHREMYYQIGLDLLKSGFHFFGGGGFVYPEGEKKDKRSLFSLADSYGYRVVREKNEFLSLKDKEEKYLVINRKLDVDSAMRYRLDKDGSDITLKELLLKAIELLYNDKGFFIMLEGGKIDWACHYNDAASTIQETIAFDDTIKAALDFYYEHPEETLILVTADHEAGGLTLGNSHTEYQIYLSLLENQKVSYYKFKNIIQEYKKNDIKKFKFSFVLKLIKKYIGLGKKGLELSKWELKDLKRAFKLSKKNVKTKKDKYLRMLYSSEEPIAIEAIRILNRKAGIGWTSFEHTAISVPLRSIGIGSEMFNGEMDNTDIYKILLSLFKLKLEDKE